MILIVYAHPHPGHSEANRVLLDAVSDVPEVKVHSLYHQYPDFAIDVPAEQALLEQARLVVWQHPIYWYSVPSLLKLWFESVLVRDWAYGDTTALAGKDCLWVTTTGAAEAAYSMSGKHAHPFAAFTPAVEQTARFCAMNWLEPFTVHGAHKIGDAALAEQGQRYRERLLTWLADHGSS
ncbi:NAD(P)H-dependent oxidoreductase [Piscinibacter sakaiensis]|uniref:glutathione-regulated potassium-efflux system oxidoreductase KefF n=1 Tax=Piscinibacter sakaiensis TaxID=1547922 RepID=UPI003AAC20E9